MQSDSAPPPPLLVYVLSSTLDVYEGPRFEKRAGFVFDKPSLFCTSEDGSVLFVSSEDDRRVATFNALTGKGEKDRLDVEQPIVKAYLSPLGSYVLSWHYPPRRRDGEPEPSAESHDNLVVWDSKTGKVVWRTQVKNQPESDVWPSIQWTDDERFAARMTTSTLHVFNGKQLDGKEEFNLVVKNMHQFSIVCGVSKDKSGENVKQYRVATFVPEKNNTMSNVMVWRIFERIGNAPQEMPQKEVTKVFGRGQKVDFLWNSPATAMVIKAFSAVDKSGGSYYGTYDCFYVRVDGSVDVTLRPKREGTIHDVKWDVHGRRFIMVYGAQPASATVYNFKANVVAEFGVGPRNFAAFSPSGQMVTLAGFGSLQGGIEVWDSKLIKKVALAESFAASTYQWAPDSRHFLTAVLQDRMKVDNMVRIFAYDGTVIKEINKGSPTLLKAVSWRPCPRGTYESQPPSPRCFEKAAKAEAAMQANPVRQKYVPPGMRNASPGAVSAASAALSNLRGTDSAAVVGRVQQSNAASSGSSVKTPAAPVAAKPQRQLIVGEVADDEEPAPARDNSKAKAKRDAKKEKQRAEAEAAQKKEESAAKPVYDADAYSTDPIAVEKRIKKLKAKLRQIDQLKGKDRATLAPEQRAKLDEEASVVRLVAELEALRPKH